MNDKEFCGVIKGDQNVLIDFIGKYNFEKGLLLKTNSTCNNIVVEEIEVDESENIIPWPNLLNIKCFSLTKPFILIPCKN